MVRIVDVRLEHWTNQQYHGRPINSLSNTRLQVFDKNPMSFYQQFQSREMDRDSSDAMDFGKVAHSVILEPKRDVDLMTVHDTLALWRPVSWVPDRDPDESSHSDPNYGLWFTDRGVYRRAIDWGRVGGAFWYLTGADVTGTVYRVDNCDECYTSNGYVTAFCEWGDFLIDGDYVRAIPEDVLTEGGRRSGNLWKAFKKRCELDGVEPMLRSSKVEMSWSKLLNMRRSIRHNKKAWRLLNGPGAVSETTLVGIDEETGLELRTRIDRHFLYNDRVFLMDLKTTRDSAPGEWDRQAIKDGLYVQAAMMGLLASAYYGLPFEYFYIAIDKKAPYRCVVHDFESDFLEIGVKKLNRLLVDFSECIRTDKWYPDESNTVHVPYWMQQDESLAFQDEPIDVDAVADEILLIEGYRDDSV